MSLARRKEIELTQKLKSLRDEFKDWRAQSATAQQPLGRHHTQIRRITDQLEGLAGELEKRLGKAAGNAVKVLTLSRTLELDILELHRIWNYFRGKLALRRVERFRPYLAAADDFAWACYDRARQKVPAVQRDRLKEPPLVFLNGGSTPFTSSREMAYDAEAVAFNEQLRTPEFIAILRSLPIPVIGVPWFQLHHLPDLLVVGHEVGHNVLEDFRLGDRLDALLQTALAKAPAERRQAWQSWRDEVFADIYGTLAAGPAFAGALMDFLATTPKGVTSERRDAPNWGLYPTDALRVLLVLEVIRQCNHKDDANRLHKEWTATYKTHAMPDFEPDLKDVVAALLAGPYPELGNASLTAVVNFTSNEQERASGEADRLLGNMNLQDHDVRVWFAGVRLAYEQNPDKYLSVDLCARVLEPLAKLAVFRGDVQEQQLSAADRNAADYATGAKLLAAIEKLRAECSIRMVKK